MAMVLQPSRVRLTQAIYFGKPAGFGVTSITGGNGITATPNPIITTGTLDLGPLTSDWNAGSFDINAQNTTLWLNVISFGADPTGGVDSTPAFQLAHTAAPASGAVICAPRGQYRIEGTVTISKSGVHVQGDGRDATEIVAAPVGPTACFIFANGASTINNCSIKGMTFRSADTVTQKYAIQADDAVNFVIEEVNITGGNAFIGGWTGASSVGFLLRGRQELRVSNCAINSADFPIIIGPNPNNATISFDHSSIKGCELVVSPVLTNAAITVQDGLALTNSAFEHLAFVRGGPGISFNNTLMATSSSSISINDIRSEQGVDAAAYTIDFRSSSGALQALNIQNARMDPARNGIRLTNAKWPLISDVIYGGAGTFLNFSASVEGPTVINSFKPVPSAIVDASSVPVTISHQNGGNPPSSGFGTLTPLAALTVTTPAYFGASTTPATTGAQLDVIRDDSLLVEGSDSVYMRSGAGATNVGLRVGTDKTRNAGYVQTIEPSTSYVTKFLALNPNGGSVGINTGATTATRTLDLNGVQRYRGQAAPAVSEANSGTIYFDSATNKLKASLNGSAYVDIIGSGGLTGSGTTGQVAYWDGTTSLASPSAIYIDAINNRIGINVPAPTYPFDIDGDINVINAPATIRLAGDPVMQAGTGATKLGGTHGIITASDTAIGSGAMANASGAGAGGNTAIGLQAMGLSTAAENNTAVGALALDATQGVANVAVGVAAGLTNTTGSYNIFIGETADATAGNLTNAGAIGRGATVAQSNSLCIGGGIQGVGIKTSTPKVALDVGGAIAVFPVEVTLVNGLNSDISPLVDAGMLRIVGPTGAFSLGGFGIPTGIPGISGPTGGQMLYVFNSEAQQMTIVEEDLLSTAIFRIKTLTGGDVVLRAGTSAATFVYDDSVDRWLLMSSN